MSIDNTIIVIENLDRNGSSEYRVGMAQAAENLTWGCSDGAFNPEYALVYFADSPVYTTEAEAFTAAAQMFHEADGYVQYGIVPVRFPQTLFPKGTEEDGLRAIEDRIKRTPGVHLVTAST